LLCFCDQRHLKNCSVFDGYEVVTASILGRNVSVIENIIVKINY